MNSILTRSTMESPQPSASDPSEHQVIELGVIIAGPLETVDRKAIDAAVTAAAHQLRDWFPNLNWHLPQIRRDEWSQTSRVEPTDLLQYAREERDERGWDFTFVVTAADLNSHYKPFALAVVSRTLDGAIISTARVDPRATDPDSTDAHRSERIKQCVIRLMMHTIGHWLGLVHHTDEANIMRDIDSVDDLPCGEEFTPEQLTQMRSALDVIADQRLEERADIDGTWSPLFVVLAAWENRWEIVSAVLQARPWEFPIRLSRLTTAAVSTVLVLLMTAETWDMAMSQSWATVVGFFALSITATTGYVAVRQQLLIRRNGREISEQIVASNTSASAIVACGMLVMFVVLFVLTLVADLLLFPDALVEGWAASLGTPLRLRHSMLMAGIVASLGIVIGALGSSFEQQHYFRHVVFVDEEV